MPDPIKYPKMRELVVFYRLECSHGGTCEGWPGESMICEQCGSMQAVSDCYEVTPWENPS